MLILVSTRRSPFSLVGNKPLCARVDDTPTKHNFEAENDSQLQKGEGISESKTEREIESRP